jgi:hypothetical protein
VGKESLQLLDGGKGTYLKPTSVLNAFYELLVFFLYDAE